MKLHEEFAELQGQSFEYDKEEASLIKNAQQHDLYTFANDHSDLLRGTDGRVHDNYQDDTLINIGGIETTYGNAMRLGLLEDSAVSSPFEPLHNDDTEHEEENEGITLTLEGLSDQLEAQTSYAKVAAGEEVFEKALMGDTASIKEVAAKADASEGDTVGMLQQTMAEYLNAGFDYAGKLLGESANEEHIRQYFASTALSFQDRQAILRSVARRDISGVYGFVERYRAAYGQ